MVSHEAIDELHRKLVDTGVALPARFRALFSLRGIGGAQAIAAMLDGVLEKLGHSLRLGLAYKTIVLQW